MDRIYTIRDTKLQSEISQTIRSSYRTSSTALTCGGCVRFASFSAHIFLRDYLMDTHGKVFFYLSCYLMAVFMVTVCLCVQVIPLASQFRDLHSDIVDWMKEAESELQQKAVTPDQIKQRQQSNKVR